MHSGKNWMGRCQTLVLLILIALPLLAASAGSAATTCDTERNQGTASSAKYQLELDDSYLWQASGGTVFFTVTGLNPQNGTSIAACLRLEPKDPKQLSNWSNSWPTEPMRVEQLAGKAGMRFAATIPWGFRGRGFYPVAQLRVIVSDPSTPSQPTLLDVVRDVRVSPRWFAVLLAAVFVVAAAVGLYRFGLFLGVPGKGVVLRIISTASGWASLAQFQIILWTLLIGAGAVYVMTLRGSLIEISSGTLELLGIAGAAALGSQLKSSQQTQPAAAPVPPGPITGLRSVSMLRASEAMLSWAMPAGGGAPSAYTVQFRPPGRTDWLTASTAVTKPSFMLVGLDPATTYDVQVFATNAAGSGAPMATKVTTTDAMPAQAGAPAGRFVLDRSGNVTADSVPLSWNGRALPGGDQYYIVQFRAHDSDEDWQIRRSNEPSMIVTGLRANTAYDFQVFETNSSGNGPLSDIRYETSGPALPRVPRWSDIVTDTDRPAEIDVTRVQMLFFTIISACFVAMKIAYTNTIPEIPGSYVALMGISNGVYLTAKFVGH